MFITPLWLWALLYLVNAQNETSCESDYKLIDSGKSININILCSEKPCMVKCCPENQILFYHEANDTTYCFDSVNLTSTLYVNPSYSFPIYDKNFKQNSLKAITTVENFTLIYNENFISWDCSKDIELYYPSPKYVKYILENGFLLIRKFNYFNQWVTEMPPGEFCVDRKIVVDVDGAISEPRLAGRMTTYSNDAEDKDESINKILAYGMIVSCIFLTLVLVVYALLRDLRNLAGLVMMAYVATLLTAFFFRAVQVLASENIPLEKTTCIWLYFIVYYTTVACFTWMNVMSFDIWWVMRSFDKLRHTKKLGWYGLYGWGAPLLPIVFMIIVENIDMRHLPNFVKPHYSDPSSCFMEEEERQLYMNGPILITLCINIPLFLMTACNIWRIKRGVAQYSTRESRRNKHHETRFGIYLKIALVMGINWILEIMSSLYADSKWWYITDVFNSLIGMFIFIIFICKRDVIFLVCKRFTNWTNGGLG